MATEACERDTSDFGTVVPAEDKHWEAMRGYGEHNIQSHAIV